MKPSDDHQNGPATGTSHLPRLPLLRTPLQGPYAAMYGSDEVAATYCGFQNPPAAPAGLWMHGWYPERRPLDRPERLFDVTMGHLTALQYWVTTERQAEFLRGLGYTRSRAIGLPLVYVPEPRNEREKDSLLVMPAHSLPANDRAWATADYVAAIVALRPAFRRITVCVGGHDWARGNWVGDFRAAGFEVIRGAGDDSSLDRMACLFAQFEAVSTNGFGSLLAYASAFGAKVSIYGPFSEVTPDSLRNVPFFIDNPDLIAAEVDDLQASYCRETFPEFFCHPAVAEERVEWGRAEIGWENRVSPEELRGLFGWSALGRATSRVRTLGARARALVPASVKTRLKDVATPEGRSLHRERARLEAMETGVPGTTTLFGATFAFADARAYLQAYDDCFVKHIFRFRATSERPFVIDGNAGSGLAVLYFKCLYPRSRILALEVDGATFGMLEFNCRSFGLDDVDLVQDTLSAELLADAPVDHVTSGTTQADCDESHRATVPAVRVACDSVERIDMLKLRISASRAGAVRDLAELLALAESVSVDYCASAGEPQDLDQVFNALQRAGLRVAIQSADSTLTRPLVEIPGSGARETHLRILGFRV